MIIEVWTNEDGSTITSSTPENIIKMKEYDEDIQILLFIVEGEDYNNCMTQVNEKLGWEPYKPMAP